MNIRYGLIIALSLIIKYSPCFGQQKVYRIGVYENPPKIYINDNGQADGFFVDLLSELGQRLNFKTEYVIVNWQEGLKMLEAGKIDIMPDIVKTEERVQRYSFNHITIIENWASLYIHDTEQPEYYTLQDLKGKSIGVMENDNNYRALKNELDEQGIEALFTPFKGYPEVMQAVSSKEVSMGLISYYFGKFNSEDYDVQELQLVVNPATIHLAAMPGSHDELLRAVDEELVKMKGDKNSVYYQLVEKWLDTDQIYKFPRWLSILLVISSFILLLLLIALIVMFFRLRKNKRNLDEANKVLSQQIKQKNKVENSLRKRNEELANTNHSLDHLVYQLSHNLRAPIASVMGLTNVIKHDLPELQSTSYIEKMETSMQRLDGIISDILEYYKNSRSDIDRSKIDWEALISQIFKSMEYLQTSSKIELQVNIDQQSTFICDQQRLKSILHNLISNALKYYDPGKTNPYIRIEGQIDKKKADLRIADNGTGISPELQEKIFNMFFRGSDRSQGAGLGLYIAKETVKKIKGTLNVESKAGKGTTFHLEVPNMCEES